MVSAEAYIGMRPFWPEVERAHVVEPHHMIGVGMREDNGVDVGDLRA